MSSTGAFSTPVVAALVVSVMSFLAAGGALISQVIMFACLAAV